MKRKTQKYESQINAVKEANSGRKHKRSHNKKISNSLKAHKKDALILATNEKTGKEITFKTQAECARKLKCTRQMVGQCILRPTVYHFCRGWKLTIISNKGV